MYCRERGLTRKLLIIKHLVTHNTKKIHRCLCLKTDYVNSGLVTHNKVLSYS